MTTTIPLTWRIGEHRIQQKQMEAQRLIDILDLIKTAESEYYELTRYAAGPFFDAFPEQKGKALRGAKIRKHQSLRLQRIFTINANELSL